MIRAAYLTRLLDVFYVSFVHAFRRIDATAITTRVCVSLALGHAY